MTSKAVLHVCEKCRVRKPSAIPSARTRSADLRERIARLIGEHMPDGTITISSQSCLGNCTRALRVSVAEPGRWSWLIGDIVDDEDCIELIGFIRQWLSAPQGLIAKRDRSAWLIAHTLGRIPPMDATVKNCAAHVP